jgi:hypothetical protein
MEFVKQVFRCDWPGCKTGEPHYHFSQISDPNSWDVEQMEGSEMKKKKGKGSGGKKC